MGLIPSPVASLALLALCPACLGRASGSAAPAGRTGRDLSALDSLLVQRRSVRSYADSSLTREEVVHLLWAACGLLPDERRTVPSAGALYPLRLIVVCGDVEGISAGIYGFSPTDSSLTLVAAGDLRDDLSDACAGQPWVSTAPAAIVIAAEPEVTVAHYGDRGMRYVILEAGHASQNIYLECASISLGTVAVGAFDDSAVAAVCRLSADEMPIYVMPVGRID